MIKIVVIDDQPLILQSIISTIDWRAIGCEVVGKATDGNEGKEVIESLKPDIVITDIKMPIMDGLQLIEYAKNVVPKAKFIIITGYNEFSYAQRALKLGAFDLILKPIDSNNLQEIIVKAVNEINKFRIEVAEKENIIKEKNKLINEVVKNTAELKRKFIIDVINGYYITREKLDEKIKELNLSLISFFTFVIKPYFFMGHSNDNLTQMNLEFNYVVEKILHSTMYSKEGEFIEFWLNNNLVILYMFNKRQIEYSANHKIINIINSIQEGVRGNGNYDFDMGVSSISTGNGSIKKSYDDACKALNYRFLIAENNVVHLKDIQGEGIIDEELVFKKISKIYQLLLDSKVEENEIVLIVDEIINIIIASGMTNIDYIKSLLIDICMASVHVINNNNLSYELITDSDKIYNNIYMRRNIKESYLYIKQYILNIYNKLHSQGNKKYSNTVNAAIEYLNENYSSKISLKDVADFINVSPEHLSRLIKKETGENFTDILSNIRVKYAMKLLQDTNIRVNEIGDKVGLSNYAYFYQLFKKATGHSPKDYRNLFNENGMK